jgi:small-conductance mechanosensitive channel
VTPLNCRRNVKLKKIPDIIRQIIELQETVRFDRAHFKEFGESALNFEIVYYVLSSDYGLYMNIQQAINLAIYEGFKQQEITFAFPTRTLQIQNIDGRSLNGVLSDPRSNALSKEP